MVLDDELDDFDGEDNYDYDDADSQGPPRLTSLPTNFLSQTDP